MNLSIDEKMAHISKEIWGVLYSQSTRILQIEDALKIAHTLTELWEKLAQEFLIGQPIPQPQHDQTVQPNIIQIQEKPNE